MTACASYGSAVYACYDIELITKSYVLTTLAPPDERNCATDQLHAAGAQLALVILNKQQ